MIRLVNGRGQLGSALKKLDLSNQQGFIYHTWNVSDKSESTQKFEYEKFIKFVSNVAMPYDKIIFISTNSQNDTWYTWYKQKAESYLLLNHKDSIVLRLPTFIGTPCKLFEPDADVWGKVELISIESAASKILECIKTIKDNKNRIFNIKGETISAQLVADILKIK